MVVSLASRRLGAGLGHRKSHVVVRAASDVNTDGVAAPHTDFVSRADIAELCRGFEEVSVKTENSGDLKLFGYPVVGRQRLLGTLGRVAGLDLYITARR